MDVLVFYSFQIFCFLFASVFFLVIDAVWLTINVKTIYRPALGNLLNEKPGSYLYIGQKDENHNAHLHTTSYDFNDNLLPYGVNFFVNLVKTFFK